MTPRLLPALFLAAALAACTGGASDADSTQPAGTAMPDEHPAADTGALVNVEWQLVQLKGAEPAQGAGDRLATLTLSDSAQRATGFSGCNRATGPYTLRGDSLTFGPMVMTKMACAQGMDLERGYVEALGATRRWRLTSGQLELLDGSGTVLAAFRKAPAPA